MVGVQLALYWLDGRAIPGKNSIFDLSLELISKMTKIRLQFANSGSNVKKAMKFWQNRGYQFLRLRSCLPSCQTAVQKDTHDQFGKIVPGIFVLMLPWQSPMRNDQDYWFWINSGGIISKSLSKFWINGGGLFI